MRTIKCRGKCTSDSQYAGEWVTGGVVIFFSMDELYEIIKRL